MNIVVENIVPVDSDVNKLNLYRGIENLQLKSTPDEIRKYYYEKYLTLKKADKNKSAFFEISSLLWDSEEFSLSFRQNLVFPLNTAWQKTTDIKTVFSITNTNFIKMEGEIKMMAWCPNFTSNQEILAVLVSCSHNNRQLDINPNINNELIHIINCGDKREWNVKPSILFSFSHDWGSITSMQWVSPDEPNVMKSDFTYAILSKNATSPQLLYGHMLFCCIDGYTRICSIPKLPLSHFVGNESKTMIFNPDNVLKLGLGHDYSNDMRSLFGYPTCASWISQFPRWIVVGYSSGYIGVYDITCVDMFHYDFLHHYLTPVHKRRLSYYSIVSIAMSPNSWDTFNYTVDSHDPSQCNFVYKFTERTLPLDIVQSSSIVKTCIWPTRADLLVTVPVTCDQINITSIISKKTVSVAICGICNVVSFDKDNSLIVATEDGKLTRISLNHSSIIRQLMTDDDMSDECIDKQIVHHYHYLTMKDQIETLINSATVEDAKKLYSMGAIRYPNITSVNINPNIGVSGLAAIGFECGTVHLLKLATENDSFDSIVLSRKPVTGIKVATDVRDRYDSTKIAKKNVRVTPQSPTEKQKREKMNTAKVKKPKSKEVDPVEQFLSTKEGVSSPKSSKVRQVKSKARQKYSDLYDWSTYSDDNGGGDASDVTEPAVCVEDDWTAIIDYKKADNELHKGDVSMEIEIADNEDISKEVVPEEKNGNDEGRLFKAHISRKNNCGQLNRSVDSGKVQIIIDASDLSVEYTDDLEEKNDGNNVVDSAVMMSTNIFDKMNEEMSGECDSEATDTANDHVEVLNNDIVDEVKWIGESSDAMSTKDLLYEHFTDSDSTYVPTIVHPTEFHSKGYENIEVVVDKCGDIVNATYENNVVVGWDVINSNMEEDIIETTIESEDVNEDGINKDTRNVCHVDTENIDARHLSDCNKEYTEDIEELHNKHSSCTEELSMNELDESSIAISTEIERTIEVDVIEEVSNEQHNIKNERMKLVEECIVSDSSSATMKELVFIEKSNDQVVGNINDVSTMKITDTSINNKLIVEIPKLVSIEYDDSSTEDNDENLINDVSKEISIVVTDESVGTKALSIFGNAESLEINEFSSIANDESVGNTEICTSVNDEFIEKIETSISINDESMATKDLSNSFDDVSLLTKEVSIIADDENLATKDLSNSFDDVSVLTKEVSIIADGENLATKDLSISVNNESILTNEVSISTIDESVFTNEVSIIVDDESMVIKKLWISSDCESAFNKDILISADVESTSNKEIYIIAEDEENVLNKDIPISADVESMSTNDLPINANDDCISTNHLLTNVKAASVDVNDLSTNANDEYMGTNELLISANDESVVTKEVLISADGESNITDELFISVNDEDVPIKKSLSNIEESHLGIEESNIYEIIDAETIYTGEGNEKCDTQNINTQYSNHNKSIIAKDSIMVIDESMYSDKISTEIIDNYVQDIIIEDASTTVNYTFVELSGDVSTYDHFKKIDDSITTKTDITDEKFEESQSKALLESAEELPCLVNQEEMMSNTNNINENDLESLLASRCNQVGNEEIGKIIDTVKGSVDFNSEADDAITVVPGDVENVTEIALLLPTEEMSTKQGKRRRNSKGKSRKKSSSGSKKSVDESKVCDSTVVCQEVFDISYYKPNIQANIVINEHVIQETVSDIDELIKGSVVLEESTTEKDVQINNGKLSSDVKKYYVTDESVVLKRRKSLRSKTKDSLEMIEDKGASIDNKPEKITNVEELLVKNISKHIITEEVILNRRKSLRPKTDDSPEAPKEINVNKDVNANLKKKPVQTSQDLLTIAAEESLGNIKSKNEIIDESFVVENRRKSLRSKAHSSSEAIKDVNTDFEPRKILTSNDPLIVQVEDPLRMKDNSKANASSENRKKFLCVTPTISLESPSDGVVKSRKRSLRSSSSSQLSSGGRNEDQLSIEVPDSNGNIDENVVVENRRKSLRSKPNSSSEAVKDVNTDFELHKNLMSKDSLIDEVEDPLRMNDNSNANASSENRKKSLCVAPTISLESPSDGIVTSRKRSLRSPSSSQLSSGGKNEDQLSIEVPDSNENISVVNRRKTLRSSPPGTEEINVDTSQIKMDKEVLETEKDSTNKSCINTLQSSVEETVERNIDVSQIKVDKEVAEGEKNSENMNCGNEVKSSERENVEKNVDISHIKMDEQVVGTTISANNVDLVKKETEIRSDEVDKDDSNNAKTPTSLHELKTEKVRIDDQVSSKRKVTRNRKYSDEGHIEEAHVSVGRKSSRRQSMTTDESVQININEDKEPEIIGSIITKKGRGRTSINLIKKACLANANKCHVLLQGHETLPPRTNDNEESCLPLKKRIRQASNEIGDELVSRGMKPGLKRLHSEEGEKDEAANDDLPLKKRGRPPKNSDERTIKIEDISVKRPLKRLHDDEDDKSPLSCLLDSTLPPKKRGRQLLTDVDTRDSNNGGGGDRRKSLRQNHSTEKKKFSEMDQLWCEVGGVSNGGDIESLGVNHHRRVSMSNDSAVSSSNTTTNQSKDGKSSNRSSRLCSSGDSHWWHSHNYLIEWQVEGRYYGGQQTVSGRLFDLIPVVGQVAQVRWSKPTSQKKYAAKVIHQL